MKDQFIGIWHENFECRTSKINKWENNNLKVLTKKTKQAVPEGIYDSPTDQIKLSKWSKVLKELTVRTVILGVCCYRDGKYHV